MYADGNSSVIWFITFAGIPPTTENGGSDNYCSVGSVTIVGDYLENSRTLNVNSLTFSPSTTGDCPGEDINTLGYSLFYK